MGSVKMIKTENFKFVVDSVEGDVATVYVSALLGNATQPKDGDLLFRFDKLSRTKPFKVAINDLWAKVCSYETRLAQLIALKA